MIRVDRSSDTSEDELRPIVGDRLISITANENSITLTFENGHELHVRGSMYGSCALGVDVVRTHDAADNKSSAGDPEPEK